MKKLTFILLLLLCVNSISSQSSPLDTTFENFPGLVKTFYNGAYYDGFSISPPNSSSECATRGEIIVKFDHKIDHTKDFTFNDTYHTLNMEVYGSDDNFKTSTLIKTVEIDLSKFDENPNYPPGNGAIYTYESGYFDLPEPYFKEYGVVPTMKRYFLIGYPNNMFYGMATTYKDDFISNHNDRCEDENSNPNPDPDPDPNAKPNLTLSGLTIKVDSKTYDEYGKHETPEFVHGKEHTFNIKIKNEDNGSASSSEYALLVSEENKYPNFGTTPVYTFRTDNAGAINGNSEKEDSFSEYIYDYISLLKLENGKTYYMFVDIDPGGNIAESDETDNIYYFDFKYKKPNTGKISLKISSTSNTYISVGFEYLPGNTNLKIYNLSSGLLMLDYNVLSSKGILDISNYPDGLYAVYINDSYIKKFAIGDAPPDSGDVPIEVPDQP
ncbi:CARDB domain-containing protein [Seonamhaeicola sp.]|uniref:CARDB domain-containing protein n=1 Tax=Seonamhaeicola sp. TaxID=1912245 RepID=UPI0026323126|nr:CARDB domain-containing protein [Seonamhaeicola sp.]